MGQGEPFPPRGPTNAPRSTSAPDARFLGGATEPVLIDTREMALSIAVGFDGACDVSANIAKPEAARILRQIADQWDPPISARPEDGAS